MIEEKKLAPKWIRTNPNVKVQGPDEGSLEVLGEIEIDLGVGEKKVKVRSLLLKGLTSDLLLSFSFLKNNGIQIIKKEEGDYLRLDKLDIEVKLEKFQPRNPDIYNIKYEKKEKKTILTTEKRRVGKWVWTEGAKIIEKLDKNIISPTSDICSATESIEKAKLFRSCGKKGTIIVPCDITEGGTRDILDLATDVPAFI